MSTTYILYTRHIHSIELILHLICHCCRYQVSTGDHEMSNGRGINSSYWNILLAIEHISLLLFCLLDCATFVSLILCSSLGTWLSKSHLDAGGLGILVFASEFRLPHNQHNTVTTSKSNSLPMTVWHHLHSACSSEPLFIRSMTFIG